jgi:amino acid transporter
MTTSPASQHGPATPPAASTGPTLSLAAVTALGVGGMMGAGLYTLLGLASSTAGGLLPVSFLVAAVAAGLSVYSYAKLSTTYPSSGGASRYLDKGFGPGLVSGGLNVFQFVAYLIATALYAAGFAEYVVAVVGSGAPSWLRPAVGVGVVVLFTLVNLVSTSLVGRSETVIVAVEMAVLVAFVAWGLTKVEPSRLEQAPPGGSLSALGVLTGAALLYVTYQGFGVAATAGGNMRNPKRDLPKALYTALVVVAAVYLAVSTVTIMLLTLTDHVDSVGHLLADAGKAVAGRVGFVVISAAALLATASAVNATIFAAANIGSDVAQNRQLSHALTRTLGRSGNVALLVAAAVVVALVLFFPLSAVGQMTSLAFLVVYGAVSWGHVRLRHETGAKAWPLVAAVVVNAVLFVVLLLEAIRTGPASTWVTLLAVLVGSFAVEALYRRRTGSGQAAPARF